MKTKELNHINEPIVVFGGVYSNFQALKALHVQVKDNYSPSNIFCTGDIAAYCSQPQECIDFIREWGIHVVKGNCEESIALSKSDCGCGFDESSYCNLLSKQWYEYCLDNIDAKSKTWFNKLPDRLSFNLFNVKTLIYHASYHSNNTFLFNSTNNSLFIEEFNYHDADLVISGHSGIPFTKALITDNKQVTWHNSGVIGMPANDGNAMTWFSELSQKTDVISIQHRQLEYDYNRAHALMNQNKCSHEYAKSLITGLWPSEDILPSEEKSMSGQDLKLVNNGQILL